MTIRPIPDPDAEVARLAAARAGAETVTVPRADLDTLLSVATLYVQAFGSDEQMSLTEKLAVQNVEEVLGRHGRRY